VKFWGKRTLMERITREREQYQSFLRDRVRTLGASQPRLAAEVMILPNNQPLPKPFGLIRVDIIYGPSEAPRIERVVSAGAVSIRGERHTLDCGIDISGESLSWESTCFAFHSPTFQLGLLTDWLNKWIDTEGIKERDACGLSGVVHSCTGSASDSQWELVTDFGSAPMAAFEEFVAELARHGVRDCSLSMPEA
jgi:hypothetical protein